MCKACRVHEARLRIATLSDHGMGDAVDIAEGIAALILQHELEAAD